MRRLRTSVTLVALLVCSPIAARADVVLDWNAIAVSTLVSQGQSPFAQARFMAITQLAVFEAVNAITGDYKPYLGTVVAPVGASADAAAVAAAYRVLKNYFPLAAANLDAAYAASLAAIPNGSAKSGGIATGEAAAAQMIALRLGDGSSPAQFYLPASTDPGVWQLTPSCPAAGGVNFQWQNMTPFGVPSVPGSQAWIAQFAPGPPPALTSKRYARDYNEVKRVGNVSSDLTERPQDRADVARFYAASSPSLCVQPGREAGRRRGGQLAFEECAGPRPAQYGQQRQPRRVVLDEVSLQALAARDGDFRGQPGWQRENRRRHHLCAVHSHAVFPQLSVESRERRAIAPPRF